VHGAGRPKSLQERFGAGVGCKRSKANDLAKAGPTREPRIATNDRFNQVTADAISGGGRRAYLPRSRSGSSGGLEDGTRVQTGESIGAHREGDMPRLRSWAIFLGGVSAVVMLRRHARRPAGLDTPGGIVMSDAAGYDSLSKVLLGSFYRSVAADVAAAAPPGGLVLDVGCGPGHLANRLANDHGLEVTGMDLDPAMIERARVNAEHSVPAERRPAFVVGSVAALPFADRSFDLVVSTLSMHHWADAATGQAEIDRVLRPGGRALVWDIRPGVVPLHRHQPDPLDKVAGSALQLVSVTPWRWPWRLAFTQRIELRPGARDAAPAGA
jgi:SAM-dependent methyltransferase